MANYFPGARDFTITGGTFGPDYSQRTTYHGPVHNTTDYSRHTTNYGGYVNRGQHADRGGTINNNAPQTTNHGPVYGYQQYPAPREGTRPRPPPPDVDDEFDPPPRNPTPNSRSGQQFRREPQSDRDSTHRSRDSDGNINGDDSDDQHEPSLPPRPTAQLRSGPRRRPSQAERSGNRDDSFDDEFSNLSPEMQRYIQKLMRQRNGRPPPPARPEKDLLDRMADMRLDDTQEPSRPPAGRRSPRSRPQNPPRGTRGPPPARRTESRPEIPAEEEDDSESDGDFAPRGHTIITNTDSQNVNSTNVVDSHNDNSTRTEISKGYSAR